MEIPSKKRRVEEMPDFGKCIIFQGETRESLVQSVSEEAYASVLHFAHSRTAYGENEFATISRLLERVSAEELRQNNAASTTGNRSVSAGTQDAGNDVKIL